MGEWGFWWIGSVWECQCLGEWEFDGEMESESLGNCGFGRLGVWWIGCVWECKNLGEWGFGGYVVFGSVRVWESRSLVDR